MSKGSRKRNSPNRNKTYIKAPITPQQQLPSFNDNPSVEIQTAYRSAPIPSALEFEQYRQVLPTAPDRILTMAEKEQIERHEFRKREQGIYANDLSAYRAEKKRGQIFGLICIFGLMPLVYIGYEKGHTVAATILATSVMLGLAIVFITGRERAHESSSIISNIKEAD